MHRRFPPAGALFCLLLAACPADDGRTVVTAPAAAPIHPDPARTPDNTLVAERLRRVDARARELNPFLGEGIAPRLRAALSDEPQAGYDLERWLLRRRLARHELRLGNEERALELLTEARRFVEPPPAGFPDDARVETLFELGVAWMRRAETLNCRLHHTAESCLFPIEGGGVHVDREASTKAADAFREVIRETEPESWWHTKARWLLAIATMTLGTYPDAVEPELRIPPEALAPEAPFPRFREAARSFGLDRVDLAGGAIVDDFTGDGRLDVLTSTSDTGNRMAFFAGTGDGTFVEVTEAAGLAGMLGGLNMVHADYDGDGDLDVLVLRGGWWRDEGAHPNSLLRNEGDGRFLDVTDAAGLGERAYPTQTAAWADYDLDGDLDLYVGNESDPGFAAPSQLFRNEGDGTFVDVAAEAGVTNDRYAKAVHWGDYDDDRDPDLYVSNNNGRNRLYRNEGDGTFVDVAADLGVDLPFSSFPAFFFFADDDGRLDLFVSAYGGRRDGPEMGFVAAEAFGLPHRGETQRLYLGTGEGFEDATGRFGLDRTTLPMGHNFGDLDDDGRLDLYLGTGYPYYEGLTPNVFYRNDGGTRFVDVTAAAGLGHLQKGHAVVFADLDGDGDTDLFEQMGGAYPGDAFANALYLNPGFGHGWLAVDLRGTASNARGVGARLRVELADGRTIHRVVGSGGTFGGNPITQRIGLGTASRVEALEVFWPVTGRTQRFADLPANVRVEVTEGDPGVTIYRSPADSDSAAAP